MGFWQFNPPEPCGNPPAGYCQCTPCRWRITLVRQGAEPFIYFLDSAAEADYFENVGLPRAMHGYTCHAEWLRRGVVSFRPRPWHRLWQSEFTFAGTDYSWVFGYGRWIVEGATALDDALLDEIGWGFAVTDRPVDHAFTPWEGLSGRLTGNQNTPLWLHINGYHGAWKCWGENKLVFVGKEGIGGDTFDPENEYIVVEPEL